MAITINWGTKVINVPQADLTPLGGDVYELDANWFRLELKSLEDSDEGMIFPKTHNHNTEVVLSGVTYARIIEIINGYTITFEDGQYAVNVVGANSNISDVTNVNQVSIRMNNSAGLITVDTGGGATADPATEHNNFSGGVTLDVVNGSGGIIYPIGTAYLPVNNLVQAKLIAAANGFNKIFVRGDLTVALGMDVSDLIFIGEGANINTSKTTITLVDGCITNNTRFEFSRIEGYQDGECVYSNCVIGEIFNAYYQSNDSVVVGPIELINSVAPNQLMLSNDCVTSNDWLVVDYNDSPMTHVYSNFSGRIKIINCTDASANVIIRLNAGVVWIDASCTAGNFNFSGVGNYVNDSAITTIVITGLSANQTDINSINDKIDLNVTNLKLVLGLVGRNYRIVNQVYNPQGNLLSCKTYVYDSAIDCTNDVNRIGEHSILVTYDGTGKRVTEYTAIAD